MHDAKSFFVDTFKYDFKEKLFFEHILFFSRDTNDFKLVFEQKTN